MEFHKIPRTAAISRQQQTSFQPASARVSACGSESSESRPEHWQTLSQSSGFRSPVSRCRAAQSRFAQTDMSTVVPSGAKSINRMNSTTAGSWCQGHGHWSSGARTGVWRRSTSRSCANQSIVAQLRSADAVVGTRRLDAQSPICRERVRLRRSANRELYFLSGNMEIGDLASCLRNWVSWARRELGDHRLLRPKPVCFGSPPGDGAGGLAAAYAGPLAR